VLAAPLLVLITAKVVAAEKLRVSGTRCLCRIECGGVLRVNRCKFAVDGAKVRQGLFPSLATSR
jgi:hypothetical protein